MAVSNLDMHALFVLGDLRAKLVKLFQSRFVYITEQNAEGIYVAEIDTESALVVDDKPGLKLKVGDHFSASVLPSREGGKMDIRFAKSNSRSMGWAITLSSKPLTATRSCSRKAIAW